MSQSKKGKTPRFDSPGCFFVPEMMLPIVRKCLYETGFLFRIRRN